MSLLSLPQPPQPPQPPPVSSAFPPSTASLQIWEGADGDSGGQQLAWLVGTGRGMGLPGPAACSGVKTSAQFHWQPRAGCWRQGDKEDIATTLWGDGEQERHEGTYTLIAMPLRSWILTPSCPEEQSAHGDGREDVQTASPQTYMYPGHRGRMAPKGVSSRWAGSSEGEGWRRVEGSTRREHQQGSAPSAVGAGGRG